MRIGISAILGTLGGPATYARELIHALARIDAGNEYVVITDAPAALGPCPPNVLCVEAPLPTPLLTPAWDHLLLPRLIRRHRLNLFHGTKGTLPLWRQCPEVVTVHDLAVYHQPETFALLQRLHQRTHTPYAVRRAERVIAVSQATRRDILELFAVPESKIAAIPLAAAADFTAVATPADETIAAALRLPPRYVLYAGTIQPRKNVELLVEAFAQARRGDVQLLIVGRVRPGHHPGFLDQPPQGVRYLGVVSDAQLAVSYRRALALISPSTYEGFGLSLLEAMSSGCLVVSADNSAIPELVGDCGILLPELTVERLRAAIERIATGDATLDALRAAALRRAARYSWEETARRTLEVYRGLGA